MKYILALLITLSSLYSQSNELTKGLIKYKKVEFYSYFFHIYNLDIYSTDSKRPNFKNPHFFYFRYKRNISAKDLVETTIEEWDRLNLCKLEHAKKWGQQLTKIWPDIKTGDNLGASFDGSRTIFYQDDKEIGRIEGKIFSRAFFKIWLNKGSRIKELRD